MVIATRWVRAAVTGGMLGVGVLGLGGCVGAVSGWDSFVEQPAPDGQAPAMDAGTDQLAKLVIEAGVQDARDETEDSTQPTGDQGVLVADVEAALTGPGVAPDKVIYAGFKPVSLGNLPKGLPVKVIHAEHAYGGPPQAYYYVEFRPAPGGLTRAYVPKESVECPNAGCAVDELNYGSNTRIAHPTQKSIVMTGPGSFYLEYGWIDRNAANEPDYDVTLLEQGSEWSYIEYKVTVSGTNKNAKRRGYVPSSELSD